MSYRFTTSFIDTLPDYRAFRAMADELIQQNKTTGNNQSEEYLNYTRLNIKRMDRLDKTLSLLPETVQIINNLNKKYLWIVITEAWCGDSAQNLPYIAAMAAASNGKIDLRIALRDEHEELMNAYLTNGARAIPKLVMLDAETLEELFVWGPRPKSGFELLQYYRAHKDTMTHDEFEKQLHTWYAQNKGEELQRELTEALIST